MRELICSTLARQSSRYAVVAQAGSAAEALAVCSEAAPDLVVLDIHLPDRSGLEIIPELRRASPGARILLCTAFASEDRLLDAIRAGADGFVEKTHSWKDFLNAVDCVSTGERYFRSSCQMIDPVVPKSAAAATGAPLFVLSPREREVLCGIAQGSTSKEIAARLSISVQTVETHRGNLMSKIDVHNVAGLVLFAVQNGFVKVPERGS